MIDGRMTGLTMGLGPPLFVATWVVMMVAMMFPPAALTAYGTLIVLVPSALPMGMPTTVGT